MEFLRMMGRGILALGRFIAEILAAVIRPAAHGLGAGIQALLRTTSPWFVGAGALYGLWIYRPDFVVGVVQLGVFGAAAVYGLRVMFKGIFPSKKKGGER